MMSKNAHDSFNVWWKLFVKGLFLMWCLKYVDEFKTGGSYWNIEWFVLLGIISHCSWHYWCDESCKKWWWYVAQVRHLIFFNQLSWGRMCTSLRNVFIGILLKTGWKIELIFLDVDLLSWNSGHNFNDRVVKLILDSKLINSVVLFDKKDGVWWNFGSFIERNTELT